MMFRLGLYLAIVGLSACSFSGRLPEKWVFKDKIPATRWFQAAQIDSASNVLQTTLLAVEPFQSKDCTMETAQQYCLRFVQTDVLGSPVSRQIVSPQGKWHNDGFLPPNGEARRLFLAVAQQFGFVDYADIQRLGTKNQGISTLLQQDVMWYSQDHANGVIYVFPNQNRWLIRPIEE
ncbi:MAG: hypothetical protein Q4B82_06830 [Alysiella sp.]|uniref:hypothetical protein n=1 Tax=Alysiella sp. TaxID=1872483 RepID=UPI0026DC1479|nr:hypothetical protein [Alysiella sp.]MDO4434277.1 hypothetical protein [Alysiella sp.]